MRGLRQNRHYLSTVTVFLTLLLSFGLVARSAETEVAESGGITQAQTVKPSESEVRSTRGRSSSSSLGSAAKIERDVVYGKVDGVDLKLDIYFPKQSGTNPVPVAMYVHGGGWEHGDKSQGAGMLVIPELLKRGYLVATINYRLAPQYKFPAQIEDAKCAIRFLRANAEKYHLDVDRIGVWGGSAGGHLVALLGLCDAKAGFEGKGGYEKQSSKVQAVVDMFGPMDLMVEGFDERQRQLGKEVFGADNGKDGILKRASPITYVKKDAPPFLILQGEEDKLVPPEQSKKLHERLKEAGVSSTLIMVKHAGHSFIPVGGQPIPGRAELVKIVADFFDKNLKK
jgi:acetyl esterase/lipase